MFSRFSLIAAVLTVPALTLGAGADESEQTQHEAEAAKPMTVLVVSVSGSAEKLLAADGKETWQTLREGEKLAEQTLIRTGLRSKVVLKFDDRGEVTVRNASKFGIGEFRKAGKKVTTRLGLKYGSIRASVDSSKGPNDWQIKTATALLSVRGTSGEIAFSGDAGVGLKGTAGVWSIRSGIAKRQVRPTEIVKTDLAGIAGNCLARPIEIARRQQEILFGDVFGGLTQPEKTMVRNLGGTGQTPLVTISDKTDSLFRQPTRRDRLPGIRDNSIIGIKSRP